jgi:P27 family predicted phage terminase small subunit
MAGRKRLPTAMKVIKGTAQPCRINKQEPKPEIASGDAPAWMSAQAKEFYAEIAPYLEKLKVISKGDTAALSLLADTWAEFRQADEVLRSHGKLSYETKNQAGETMHRAYPEVAIKRTAAKHFQSLLSEFGLTPSSRSKVSSMEGGDTDIMDSLNANLG